MYIFSTDDDDFYPNRDHVPPKSKKSLNFATPKRHTDNSSPIPSLLENGDVQSSLLPEVNIGRKRQPDNDDDWNDEPDGSLADLTDLCEFDLIVDLLFYSLLITF